MMLTTIAMTGWRYRKRVLLSSDSCSVWPRGIHVPIAQLKMVKSALITRTLNSFMIIVIVSKETNSPNAYLNLWNHWLRSYCVIHWYGDYTCRFVMAMRYTDTKTDSRLCSKLGSKIYMEMVSVIVAYHINWLSAIRK